MIRHSAIEAVLDKMQSMGLSRCKHSAVLILMCAELTGIEPSAEQLHRLLDVAIKEQQR